ncbi:penicillin-binding protein PBP2B [Streptococcus thoraltensis]|uniref:penicillin-binding protein PBP2B n=1 Tax=Streptococcus thoraltensis TaxID=55085 RepID=UPI000688EBBC|nr:penicillin-binding protein PBP2B [Streptococcus thoraltensis]MDY4761965.1 penicillin-binding protein PBP2B [Streptococcus thoraltensis]
MKQLLNSLLSSYRNFPLIARRLYLIFLTVVMLFTILIIRLANMQLINGDFYLQKLKATTTYTVSTSTERGQIYDAKGKPLVKNTSKKVLTFTRSNTMTAEDLKDITQKLAEIVTFTETKVSERDKIDYYLASDINFDKVVDKLPHKQKYDKFNNSLSSTEIYANAVAAVPEEAIAFDEETLKKVAIFSQMNGTATFDTSRLIVEDLTEEQIKQVTDHASELLGVTVSDGWDREDSSSSLAPLLGRISSEKTGLPQEDAEEYLKKGYSMNDRVGTSYLEKQYESVLQGKHQSKTITVNKNGKVIDEQTTSEGSKGENLKLTIDSDFQAGVEDILRRYYQSEIGSGNAVYSDGIYAVAMNPKTGAILSMAGLSHDKGSGKTEEDVLGTINEVFTPGSVVKGATLTSGWQNGVLSGNEIMMDMPIVFAGDSTSIKSWFTNGSMPISATQALEYSSNTYMVQLALRMMGQNYSYNMPLTEAGYKETMEKLRNTYAEYGMGTSTGIDLPNVTEGFVPKGFTVSNTLTESFGQFDNYNTLQLAQYAATVSNNGNRMSAHLVEGIYGDKPDGSLGDLTKSTDVKSLNKVNITPDQMGIIRQGFYDVVNSNSSLATGSDMRGRNTVISGKTGTAETFTKDTRGQTVSTVNLNVVAYDQNNQIAVGVMYPNSSNYLSKAHQYIARDIIDLYVSSFAQ